MKYFIITGASSGLGEALATQVIKEQHKVFCVSRQVNEELKKLASSYRTGFWYFEKDLTLISEIPSLVKEIFSYVDHGNATEITLINNAGIIEPIKPLGKCSIEEIQQNVNINLIAPIALSNEFIHASETLNIKKNIINISSGAASNPYYGWTLYCSTKAGLNMVTKTVGLEQSGISYPVRMISVAPGVVDTKMQEKLREVDLSDFPMKPRFKELYEQNKLVDPIIAATQILNLLSDIPAYSGRVTDLRNT